MGIRRFLAATLAGLIAVSSFQNASIRVYAEEVAAAEVVEEVAEAPEDESVYTEVEETEDSPAEDAEDEGAFGNEEVYDEVSVTDSASDEALVESDEESEIISDEAEEIDEELVAVDEEDVYYQVTYDAGEGIFIRKANEHQNGYGLYLDDDEHLMYVDLLENRTLSPYTSYQDEDYKINYYRYVAMDPVLDGKAFKCWCTDPERENEVLISDILKTVVTEDITFYAKYVDACSVTFDVGSGREASSQDPYVVEGILPGTMFGDKYAIPSDPVAGNQTFEGWYTDEELTHKASTSYILNYVVNEDTTFYAKYGTTVNITFDPNGGTLADGGSTKLSLASDGVIGTKAPKVNAPDGKVFRGWFTDKTDETSRVNLSSKRFTADTTLYALYSDDGYYTVKFITGKDYAKFTNGLTSWEVKVKKGEPLYFTEAASGRSKVNSSPVIPLTDEIKKSGKVPTGQWSCTSGNSEAGNIYYLSSPGLLYEIKPYRVLKGQDTPELLPISGWTPSCDMTLTACWDDAIDITYDGNGGRMSTGMWITDKDNIQYAKDTYLAFNADFNKMTFTTHKGVQFGDFSPRLPLVYETGSSYVYQFAFYDVNGKSQVAKTDRFDDDKTLYARKPSPSQNVDTLKLHALEGYIVQSGGTRVKTFTYEFTSWDEGKNYFPGDVKYKNTSRSFSGWYYDEACTIPYPYCRYVDGIERLYFPEKVTDLYAGYSDTCVVTFNANGGYFDQYMGEYTSDPGKNLLNNVEEISYLAQDRPFFISAYSARIRNASDLVFDGWYLDENCTRKANVTVQGDNGSEFFTPAGDSVTLYAGWKVYDEPEIVTDGYTIDANGGYFLFKEDDAHNPQAPYPTRQHVDKGSTGLYYYWQVPIREGYTFTGWYYNSACSDDKLASATDNTCCNLKSAPADGTVLYAGWTQDTYTVTFDLNNGSGETQSIQIGKKYSIGYYDVKYAYINCYNGHEPEGAVFSYWSTDKDGTDKLPDLHYYVPGSDIRLYAVYDISYDVVFKAGNGRIVYTFGLHEVSLNSSQNEMTAKVKKGTKLGYSVSPMDDPSVSYYYYLPEEVISNDPDMIFNGWYRDEGLTDKIDLSALKEIVVNGNLTFYAGYTGNNRNSFTLYANGGTFSRVGTDQDELVVDIDDYYYDSYYINASQFPTRKGYAFTGWYSSPDCKENELLSRYGENVSQLIQKPKKGAKIYAGWTSNYYTVTLNPNGGSFFDDSTEEIKIQVPAGQELNAYDIDYYGSPSGVNSPDEDKVFDYWATDRAGKTKVNYWSFVPTKDTVLYAKFSTAWCLTYNAGSGILNESFRFDISDDLHSMSVMLVEGTYLGTMYTSSDDNNSTYRYYYIPDDPLPPAGQSFMGWCTDPGLNEVISTADIASRYISSDITFYAKYADNCTVTIDAGEGKFDSGESLRSLEIKPGIQLGSEYGPDMFKVAGVPQGKALEGWYTDQSFREEYRVEVKDILGMIIKGDVTFYAHYETAVRVTFHISEHMMFSGEGQATEVSVFIPENTAIGSRGPVVVPGDDDADYSFTGWFTKDGKKVNLYRDVISSNLDLYAGEKENGYYTIRFRTGRDDAYFTDGSQEVVIKVEKGKPFYYDPEGSGNTRKANSSPVIQYTPLLKSQKVVPSPMWICGDDEYVFSSQDGLFEWNPYWETDGHRIYMPTSGFVPSKDMTFTVKWADAVTITFDTDGGRFQRNRAVNGDSIDYEANPYTSFSQDYSKCEYITFKGTEYCYFRNSVPYPIKNNEYLQMNYSDRKATIVLDHYAPIEEDMPIYGKVYKGSSSSAVGTVTLHAGEGYIQNRNTLERSDTYTIRVNAWAGNTYYYTPYIRHDNSSKVFEGWYYDAAFSKKYTHIRQDGDVEDFFFPEKVTDLYARFVDACTVTLNANGGYFDDSVGYYNSEPDELTLGNTKAVLKAAPGKGVAITEYEGRLRSIDNQIFAGWYYDPECSSDKRAVTTTFGNFHTYFTADEDVELYAKWVSVDQITGDLVLEEIGRNLVVGESVVLRLSTPEGVNNLNVQWHVTDWGYSGDSYHVPVYLDSNGILFANGTGKADICAEIDGKYSNIITVTVNEPYEGMTVDRESVKMAQVSGVREMVTVSVKDYPATTGKVSYKVFRGENQITDDSFVKVGGDGSFTCKNKAASVTFTLEPVSVGEGYILFETDAGGTCKVDISIAENEKPIVMPAEFAGFDDDAQPAEGVVTNGQKISITSATRGASIYYDVEYREDISFAPMNDELIADKKAAIVGNKDHLYMGSENISYGKESGYVRIFAVATKENMTDASPKWIVLKIDNQNAWRDVVERDRLLFIDSDDPEHKPDVTRVVNSGLVIGYLNDDVDLTYTGEKITFDDSFNVYYDGRKLTRGTDYKVTYANNTDVFSVTGNEDAAALKKAPSFTVTLMGNYTGKTTRTFTIFRKSIKDAYITSSTKVTALTTDKKIAPVPTVKLDMPSGKVKALKAGKDFEVFYNRITVAPDGTGTVDFTHEYTADEVKQGLANKYYNYLINIRGLGCFEDDLASNAEEAALYGAAELQIIEKEEAKDLLFMNKAKVSKIPAQAYEEEGAGDTAKAKILSDNVAELLKKPDGDKAKVTVKIGSTVLKYLSDGEKAEADGAYFEIYDPALVDDSINRYPGTTNYLVIRPTVLGEGSEGTNILRGDMKVFFTITGDPIDVKYVRSTVSFTGSRLLAYVDGTDVIDKEASLAKIYGETAASKKDPDVIAGRKAAKVTFKSGVHKGEKIDTDRYNMYVTDDTGNTGTVTVVFEGNNYRGTTGKITRKIKVSALKVSSDKIKVTFAGGKTNLTVPYSKAGAKPSVVVTYTPDQAGSSVTLVEGTDYTVSYKNNTKPSTEKSKGQVSITLKGNYSGSLKNVLSFNVEKMKFNASELTVEAADKVYKAKAAKNYFKSVPAIYDNGKKLSLKTDYEYVDAPSYSYAEDCCFRDASGNVTEIKVAGTPVKDTDVVPAGAAVKVEFTARPTAKSNYIATDENESGVTSFTAIYYVGYDFGKVKVKVRNLAYVDSSTEIIPSKNDIEITPAKNAPAVQASDYEIISVTNNTRVGTATIILRGNGDYSGTKKATFKITKGTFR